jgi:hypothetical protein
MTTTTTQMNLEQMNDAERDLYEKLILSLGSKEKVLLELNHILTHAPKITMNQYLNDFKKELEDEVDDVEFRTDIRENPIPSHIRDELKEYCIERMIERKEDSPIALMYIEGEVGLKRITLELIIEDIRTIRNIKKN